MKKLLPILLLFFCSFTVATIRTVSGSTSIVTADDNNIVVATGGNATFTLSAVSAGFSTTIINHGTGTVTFSTAVSVGGGKTITTLGNYPAEMRPGWVGNTIRICYDGTTWRGY
jgi:type IV secretory pathway TrbL component